MLARSRDSTISLPLHRPFNHTESLSRMDYLAIDQYHLALRHWSKVSEAQRPGDASISPEPGLRNRCQGNRRADVEEGSSAPTM